MAFCQQVIPYLKKAKVTPGAVSTAQVAGQVLLPGTTVPQGGAVQLVPGPVLLTNGSQVPQNNAGISLAPASTFFNSGSTVTTPAATLMVPGNIKLAAGTIVPASGAALLVPTTVVTPDVPKKRVVFYASTSLSGETSDLEKSFTASGKLAVAANPIADFYLGIGANLLNVNPASQKRDSVDFNSLMFPETGNFGVLITPSYRINLGDQSSASSFSLNPFYEFAYRKVAIDSPDLAFKVFNHTIGAGLQWHYKPDADDEKNELTVNLIPYWHLFNIPTEDVKSFTTFVNDTLFQKAAFEKKSVNIGSFGIKLTAQYSNFIFFADFRRNLRARNLPDGNPFKGGAVNVGFMTSFRIGSF